MSTCKYIYAKFKLANIARAYTDWFPQLEAFITAATPGWDASP